MRVSAAVEGWVFRAYRASPADLALYRILYASYLLLAVVPAGLWIRTLPDAFFNPPMGLAALFRGFPPGWVLVALNAALGAAAGLLLVGWRTPAVSVATGALLLVTRSWEYSTGKVNHDILLVLVPLVLASSGWGRARSLDARMAADPAPEAPRPCWNLALLATATALGMFSAGVLKLISGWLDPSTHSTYGHLAANVLATGRESWLGTRLLAAGPSPLWELADWGATLLELAFLPALLHPRAMRAVLALAALFHLAIWPLFSILFSANVLAYGAFVRWSRVAGAGRPFSPRAAAVALAAAGIAAAAALLLGRPLDAALGLPLQPLVLVAGGIVGALHLRREAIALRAPERGGSPPPS